MTLRAFLEAIALTVLLVAALAIIACAPVWRGENHNPPEARTLRCAYLGVQHIDGVSNGWHVSECDGGLIVFSTPR